MKCECNLQLVECMWPLWQCDADITRYKAAQEKYNRMMPSGPYFTDEEWSGLLARCVTNQQATANHTVKMVNEAKLKNVISNLPKYDPTSYMQWEHKMTRNEAIKIANKCTCDNAGVIGILEALGLIKFDEEITELDILKQYYSVPQAIVNHLDRMGYKIVKK